ncbi:MAG TPA: hypothetical protein VKZ44_09675 [Taishania sp.]|nr:hypothetical protein [Taishania sp.]
MKFTIPSLAIISIIVSSCATTDSFVTDDVYSVKPSELPIGESLTDETSYASFKTRKLGNTDDRLTYADELAMNQRQNCLNQWRWTANCGCSYNDWYNNSPHSPGNSMFGPRMRWAPMIGMYYSPYYSSFSYGYGFGYGYGMPPYYGHPYYGYGYNPYGMGYGGYGMGYGGFGYGSPYYGYNNPYYGYGYGYPYGNYGYGYGGYGYGGNSNGWSNSGGTIGSTNTIRKARGTVSGYSNPNGRAQNPSKAGITTVNTPVEKVGATTNASRIETKPVERGSVISRESTYTRENTGRVIDQIKSDRNSSMTVEQISNTRQPSRTMEIRNAVNNQHGTVPTRTNSPAPTNGSRINLNNSTRSNPSLSSPQRSIETPSQRISTPSSTPSRTNSTPSNSGGSGRSGGGSTINSGRR